MLAFFVTKLSRDCETKIINGYHHGFLDTLCMNLVQPYKQGCVVYFPHGKNCIMIYG